MSSTLRPHSFPARTLLLVGAGIAVALFFWKITFDDREKNSPAPIEIVPSKTPSRVSPRPNTAPSAVGHREEIVRSLSDAPTDSLAAESLEALAARDPLRALSLVLAKPESPARDELLQVVLRAWAGVDADAAAKWARTQSYIDAGLAMAAVFNGASRDPAKAVQLNQRLSAEDPNNGSSYGGYLIFGLGKAEHFELAADIAAASPAEFRTDLLTAAYRTWAGRDPKRAIAAALELKDPDAHRAAFQAALGGWADANPQELTEIAIKLPEGDDRKLALTTALRNWIEKDPAAAAEWAARVKPFPEMEATLEE